MCRANTSFTRVREGGKKLRRKKGKNTTVIYIRKEKRNFKKNYYKLYDKEGKWLQTLSP